MDVKLKLFVNITADEITSHILEDNSVKIYKVKGEQISSLTEWYYFPSKILEVIEIWGNYFFLCESQGLFHVKISKFAVKMRMSCKTPTLISGTNLVIGFKCPVTITVLQNGISTCCKSENYWEVVMHFFKTNLNSDVLFEDTSQLLAKFKHRADIESTPILKTISTNTLSDRLFSKIFTCAKDEVIIIALPDSRVFYFNPNQDGSINPKLLCCLNQPVKDVFAYDFQSPDGNSSTSQALVVIGVHGRVVLFTDEVNLSGVHVEFLHIPSPVVHITPSCHGIVSYDGETLWRTVIKNEKSTDKKQRILKHHAKVSAPKFLTFATISTYKNKEVDNSVFFVREDFNLQMCTLEAANCETSTYESKITDGPKNELTIDNILSEIHLCSNTLESLVEQQDKQKRLLEEISNAAQFFHNRHQATSYFASSCEARLESRDNSIYLILQVNITNKGPIALIGPHWHLIVAVSPSGTNKNMCQADEISVITKTCPLLSGFGIQETLRSHAVQKIGSVRSLCSQLPINVSCYLQYSVPKDHTFCSKDSERVSLFLVQISSHTVDALDFTRSSKQIGNQPEFNCNTGGLGKCLENIAQEYRTGKTLLKAPTKISSRSVPKTICTCLTFRKPASRLNFNGTGLVEYFKQTFSKLKQDSREDKSRETICKYSDHLFGYEFQIQMADYGDLFRVEIHCAANMLSLLTKTVANRLQESGKSCTFDTHVSARCLSRSKELRTCLGRLSIVLQENETHSQELLIQLYEDLRKNVSSLLPAV